MPDKLKLYGFNNLTKTLSFNIYDVCYAKSEREQKDYIAYIDEQYNSERLTKILCNVTEMVGAHVLNISKQDYDPQGASVNLLITERALPENLIDKSQELAKLQKELDVSRAQLDQARARLSNQEFMSKAPQKVIQGAREVKEKLESKIEKLLLSINKLTK